MNHRKTVGIIAAAIALPALGAGLAHIGVKLMQRPVPPAPPAPPVAAPPRGAWCGEHGLPESICFICSPGLIAELGQCAEHGVPEALCTRCNKALIPAFKATKDWCQEHGLPESQCLQCNPLLAMSPAPTKRSAAPEERRRAAPSAGCRTHTQALRLASPEVARQVGITTAAATTGPFRDLISAPCELTFVANRRARLSSRAQGVVASITSIGEHVAAGQVLATIDAPELGAARAELVTARELLGVRERVYARELELSTGGLGTQRTALEADTRRAEARAAVALAEQRLRSLGLSPDDDATSLLVRAPFAGVVLSIAAAPGEVVSPGRELVALGDARTLWARVSVPEAAAARVREGQEVTLALDALPGEPVPARLVWVASELDAATRTLEARAEVDNARSGLRPGMFGVAHLTLGDRRDAVLVPREAVQWEGCCNVVFVPTGEATFSARKVQLGGVNGAEAEVLSGLAAGEQVVVQGAFLLKTELLKGSIGAGCCEGE